MRGPNAEPWLQWAQKHFAEMRRVFRRLKRTYGITSFNAGKHAAGTLAENPGTWRRAKAKRYRRMAKRPSGRNRRANNPMGNLKYGIRVPKNVKEALKFDEENKNTYWEDSIKKEPDALMGRNTFEFLNKSVKQLKGQCYDFAPLRMIFDVKVDGWRKR